MGGTSKGHQGVSNGGIELGEASSLSPRAEYSPNTPPRQTSAGVPGSTMYRGGSGKGTSDERQSPVVDMGHGDAFDEEALPPPLPPRPQISPERQTTSSSLYHPGSSKPSLQSKATTALSLTDILTQSFPDGSRGTYAASSARPVAGFSADLSPADYRSGASTRNASEYGDISSIRSYAPTLQVGGDIESLMGEALDSVQENSPWKLLSSQIESENPLSQISEEEKEFESKFAEEFNEIEDLSADGSNEGMSLEP